MWCSRWWNAKQNGRLRLLRVCCRRSSATMDSQRSPATRWLSTRRGEAHSVLPRSALLSVFCFFVLLRRLTPRFCARLFGVETLREELANGAQPSLAAPPHCAWGLSTPFVADASPPVASLRTLPRPTAVAQPHGRLSGRFLVSCVYRPSCVSKPTLVDPVDGQHLIYQQTMGETEPCS